MGTGTAEADHLYADNVSRMARSYRGIMLYHLLTAQHLLSRVNTAFSDLGTQPIRQRQQAEYRPEGLPDYRAFRVHGRARRVPEERGKIAWGQRFLPS